jgi:site-specific recombinase XerD
MGRPSKLNRSKSHGYFSIVAGRKYYFGWDKAKADKDLRALLYKKDKGERLDNPTIGPLVKEFLNHIQETQAESTYEWYLHPLEKFLEYIGEGRKLSSVTPADVDQWIAKNWKKTRTGKRMKENSIKQPKRAVKACFAWLAKKAKRIAVNPFADMKIGDYHSSDNLPDPDQLAKLVKHFQDDPDFIDFLNFETITGTRVEETWTIESSQVDVAQKQIVLSEEQTKAYDRLNKKNLRTIILNDAALCIVKRNLKKNPEGLLFQNPNGRRGDRAWTPAAVRSRFRRAEEELGFRIEHRSLRRYWATEFLKRTNDVASGAALMGHSSPRMLLEVYQKIAKDTDHLRQQANKVELAKPAKRKRRTATA